jgi:L(+)-tartrate dehydratase beta subunit
MRKFGGCYLAIVGGAAALETTQIEAIEEVYWEDLMPECIWKFRVKDLGPLTVAIDSHGGDLYAQVKNEARKKMQGLLQELSGSESKNKLKN